MSEVCSKCKKDTKEGCHFVEGGILYKFCKECSDILESFPSKTGIISLFLTPDEQKSQADKNIFEARRRRAQGKGVWS